MDNLFKVEFHNYNGDVLKTEYVESGNAATPPSDPVREGYDFTGWSVNFDIIDSDLVVVAQYTIREMFEYTIDNNQITITGLNSEDVELITIPEMIEGKVVTTIAAYTFFGQTEVIREIVLPKTITKIEEYALSGLSYLEKITLPFIGESKTAEGDSAYFGYIFGKNNYTNSYYANGFYLPLNLKEIIITDSDQIKSNALSNLENLLSITVPNTVILIKEYAFDHSNIEHILFEEESNLTTIEAFAFSNITSLKSITIPQSVTTIGYSAFFGTYQLESMTLPFVGQSRDAIGNYARFGYIFGMNAFDESYYADGSFLPVSLKEINITDASIIGVSAFNGSVNIQSVRLSSDVTSIGDYAFVQSGITEIVLPNGVSYLGNYAFYESKLSNITLSENLSTIGVNALSSSYLIDIFVDEKNNTFSSIDGVLFNHQQTLLIKYPQGKDLLSYTIPNTVIEIEQRAFTDADKLVNLYIPEGLQIIGAASFFRASNLTNIQIPNSVIEIGPYAFLDTHITSIEIPSSMTAIGQNAFAGLRYLLEIVIPSNINFIGEGAFAEATSLQSIVIPNSVTNIGEGAFSGAINLGSMTIPFIGESREATGINAYFGYIFGRNVLEGTYLANGYYIPHSLIEITITNPGLIDSNTFKGISSLENIIISEGNPNYLSVEGVVFNRNKTELIKYPEGKLNITFSVPEGVLKIHGLAISNNKNLENVTVPNSVTWISLSAFSGLSNLKSISLPFVGLTRNETDTYARLGCVFGKLNYDNSYEINDYYLPNDLTSVSITNATKLEKYAFNGVKSLKSIDLNQGITTIGEHAFSGLFKLTTINLPNTITSIGDAAFSGANQLTHIEIPDSVTYIGKSILYGASKLESITLPYIGPSKGYTGIYAQFGYIFGHASYEGSYKAQSTAQDAYDPTDYYYLPDTLREVILTNATNIGANAFNGVKSITTLVIPKSVTTIGYSAFTGTSGLSDIIVHEDNLNFTSIDGILYNKDQTMLIKYPSNKIDNIFFVPNNVTSIYSGAFAGAVNLEKVVIPNSVISMGLTVFTQSDVYLYIFAEFTSKPSGWDSNWKQLGVIVLWSSEWYYDTEGNPQKN